MSVVFIGNGDQICLAGLGKVRAVAQLSEKRVTKAVREALRTEYGQSAVKVSCTATLSAGQNWEGGCSIHGKPYRYTINPGD